MLATLSASYFSASDFFRGMLAIDTEDRSRFDDGVVVRKGMEGLDGQLAFAGFDVDEADRAERDTAAGVERVDHFVAGSAALQLVLQHPEHIGGDMLEFEARGVLQPSFSVEFFRVFSSQIEGEQPALLRKWLLDRSHHFRDGGPSAASEVDHMPIAGDIDSGSVVFPFERARAMRFEKLGVDRSSEDTEDMVCNGRSDRKHESSLPWEWWG